MTSPPPRPNVPAWDSVPSTPKREGSGEKTAASSSGETYLPLLDTFRLYAGWLLAWYAVVFLVGTYQASGRMPFEIAFMESLYRSPFVLRFAFATYLFLLLSSVYRYLGKGTGKATLLTLVWIGLLFVFIANT